MSENRTEPTSSPEAFFTTRWTMVMRARGDAPEARAALGELCEAYWAPVFHFLKREGRDADTSRELTQSFFERILASRAGVDGADPGKGRFRSYLLGALKNFLAELRRNNSRLKRGGDAVVESIDAEELHAHELAGGSGSVPDSYFDRQWALALVERALESACVNYDKAGKRDHFEAFKPWLVGTNGGQTQEEVARSLGMTGGAVKVAIHRMRERFRKAVCDEIRQTVSQPDEVSEELSYLVEALSAASWRP